MTLPGCPALTGYLARHRISLTAFALQHGMDPSQLAKLMRGERQRVSVGQAAQIEDATKGEVGMRLWIPEEGATDGE